jgi:hypothetical protein
MEQLFTTSNLQLGLLIGSGVLAISLLVLALTRWGQSSPVWKCVILSIVAHILLIGYAYGTYTMFDPPPLVKKPDLMRVNLIDECGKSVIDSDLLDASPQPWDQFVSKQTLPTFEDLERPVIETEVILERRALDEVNAPVLMAAAPEKIELPQIITTPPTTEIELSDIAAIALDSTRIASPEIQIKRRGEESPPHPESPRFENDLEFARADVSNDFQPTPEPQPTATDPEPTFTSELIDRNSDLPLAAEFSQSVVTPPTPPQLQPLKKMTAANRMRLTRNPRRLADGQPLPKIYSLRNVNNRLEVAQRRGGSIETEAAVSAALHWLAEHQEEDGSWDPNRWGGGRETQVFGHDRKGAGSDADCGITGLAALSFLAAGHTHLEGPYQDQLRKSFEYLVRQQQRNGSLAGDARLFAKMYCHSMSLLALSEALALTGDQRLQQPVQRGVDYSLSAQNRQDGGWRYQPGDAGDLSQFGWQVLALHSAKLGGAVVPEAAFMRMQTFLDKCSSGVGGGLAAYRPGQGPSTSMTAEALLCRYILDQSVPPTTLMEATRRIATELPTPHHVNLYYWYYGTLAMYHAGGSDWENWNTELKNSLLGLQIKTGDEAGSWAPNGLWGSYGGRVYATAMATLNLEVYYRYLPMNDIAEYPDANPLLR